MTALSKTDTILQAFSKQWFEINGGGTLSNTVSIDADAGTVTVARHERKGNVNGPMVFNIAAFDAAEFNGGRVRTESASGKSVTLQFWSCERIGLDSPALDINNTPVGVGDGVVCVDSKKGGDSGDEWDLVAGRIYTIESVDSDLTYPMVWLEGGISGPVFPERFIKTEFAPAA